MSQENVLSIKNLTVHYITKELSACKAVNNFSLDIKKGETIGLVGETGAGKTTVALSILRLLQSPPGKILGGEIIYKDKDLLKMGMGGDTKNTRQGDIHDIPGSYDRA
jgi:peptide/nickel transport system ATP-binding protein